ncbi:MAG: PEP-CTERM sorting domain-containing protein [Planctomycetota bacterium]
MRNKSVFLVVIVVLFVLSIGWRKAEATVYFNDGGTHTIGYAINDYVQILDSPGGGHTTLSVNSGGFIAQTLSAKDNSQVTIYGGEMGDDLCVYDNAIVTVLSGRIDDHFLLFNDSQVTISGGEMGLGIETYDASKVIISGGVISDWVAANNFSEVYISGGSIATDLVATKNSIITIFGSDFAIDGLTVGYGELSSILGNDYNIDPARRLTGTLENGQSIDNDFYIGFSAKIVLVPEPATLLLLGLGAVILRKKHRA